MTKKWGILIKKESESLEFAGLKIPRDYHIERAVDFGAGYGFWTYYLSEKKIDVTSIELMKERVDFINELGKSRKITTMCADITKPFNEKESYNLSIGVHMLHVLQEWEQVLLSMINAVEFDSYIMIIEPNVEDERFNRDLVGSDIYKMPDDFNYLNCISVCEKEHCELIESYDIKFEDKDSVSDKILVFKRKRK